MLPKLSREGAAVFARKAERGQGAVQAVYVTEDSSVSRYLT